MKLVGLILLTIIPCVCAQNAESDYEREILSPFRRLAKADLPPFGRKTPSADRKRCQDTIKDAKEGKKRLEALLIEPAKRKLLEEAVQEFDAACETLARLELFVLHSIRQPGTDLETNLVDYANQWFRGQEKLRFAFMTDFASLSQGELLGVFQQVAEAAPPTYPESVQGFVIRCWNGIADARYALPQMERVLAGVPGGVRFREALGHFESACRSIERSSENPEFATLWERGRKSLQEALTGCCPQLPPASQADASTTNPLTKLTTTSIHVKANEALLTVQRLSSAFELDVGKDEMERRLVDAHAAVEDLEARAEDSKLRLFTAILRQVVLEYRLALRSKGDERRLLSASGKDKLDRARKILRELEAEEAP